uniref:Differentially expressed in FDCP 8 n=1 Tax=Lygus hesperus TaxID=30085 RepID=A0A0A9WWV9_LYGHE
MEAVEAVNLTPSPSPDGVSGDELSDSSLNLSSSFINAENYITIKEGCQSAFTIDELSEAITRCKKLVLESEQCSDERKWFVRRLIELRHRLEQAKENENAKPTSEIEETLVRLGHNFKLQPPPTPSTKKVYCDYCCGSIWNVVQSYYRCIDCRYKCHDKCSQLFHRVCPILMLSEVPKYEERICPEEGLDKQCYRCEECQARISFTLSKGYLGNPFSSANSLMEARKCDYNGKYYCRNCHWGTLSVIPARILRNWEFEPHMVSRASFQLIKMARHRPIISLDPRIYSKIDDLRIIKKMREELLHMRHYIATCRVSLETGFLKELEWGNSLIHSTELFTLEDLIAVKNGTFLPQIEAIHERLRTHIKSTCEVCKGRGFLCSYCLADDAIYPFDAETAICSECNSVRHKHCAYKSPDCPKCLRKKRAQSSSE